MPAIEGVVITKQGMNKLSIFRVIQITGVCICLICGGNVANNLIQLHYGTGTLDATQ